MFVLQQQQVKSSFHKVKLSTYVYQFYQKTISSNNDPETIILYIETGVIYTILLIGVIINPRNKYSNKRIRKSMMQKQRREEMNIVLFFF